MKPIPSWNLQRQGQSKLSCLSTKSMNVNVVCILPRGRWKVARYSTFTNVYLHFYYIFAAFLPSGSLTTAEPSIGNASKTILDGYLDDQFPVVNVKRNCPCLYICNFLVSFCIITQIEAYCMHTLTPILTQT